MQLISSKCERKWRIKPPKYFEGCSRRSSSSKKQAQADITVERDSALNSVKDDVAELSLQIAEKILNKELSPEMHESLINQYIEGLGSSNETR